MCEAGDLHAQKTAIPETYRTAMFARKILEIVETMLHNLTVARMTVHAVTLNNAENRSKLRTKSMA